MKFIDKLKEIDKIISNAQFLYEEQSACMELAKYRRKLVDVLVAAQDVSDTLIAVQSALRDVKSVYNDNEQALLGSGMSHDLTNLWNCSQYIENLEETIKQLNQSVKD